MKANLIIGLLLVAISSWGQVAVGRATTVNAGSLVYQPPPPPPSAPIISLVSSNTPGTNYANITWTTDVTTTNDSVYFDSSSTYLWESNTVAGGTSHSLWLSNLTEATTYQFKVSSWGANGLSATSTPSSFVAASTYVPFVGFTNDFSSGMNGLVGTKWGVSGGYLTNNTGLTTELINDPSFGASTNWEVGSNVTIANNSSEFTGAPSAAGIYDTPSSRFFYPGAYWDRYQLDIQATNASGYFNMAFSDYDIRTGLTGLTGWHSYGPFSGWVYIPGVSFLKNQISTYSTGTVDGTNTFFSHKQSIGSEVHCLTNIPSTNNVSVTVKISQLPSNGVAGIVLRQNMLQHVLVVGDSKSIYWAWPRCLTTPLLCGGDVINESGANLAGIWTLLTNDTTYPAARTTVARHYQNVDIALINATVNATDDGTDPVVQRATQLTYLTNIVRCLQTNYPLVQCYLANLCASNRSLTNINMSIDTCITNNSSFCHHGMDERVWFGNTNAWALYSDGDGVHYNYNTTGAVYAASQWLAAVQSNTNANSQMDCVYAYYDDSNKGIWVRTINHGTNTVLRFTATSWVSNATFTASIYTNKVKVFYNGSLVGSHDHLGTADTLMLTNVGVGVFATEPQTKFSYLSVVPSTDSDTVP